MEFVNKTNLLHKNLKKKCKECEIDIDLYFGK